jgi:hypothetical protein
MISDERFERFCWTENNPPIVIPKGDKEALLKCLAEAKAFNDKYRSQPNKETE